MSKNYSSRHHYIPQFLIKGFTNENNEVHIYDKKSGKILTRTRPSKSIFWEEDRNTFDFGENKSSVIEDVTYREVDKQGAEVIRFLRSIDLNDKEIPLKYIYKLQIFIINLFWRIPDTDELFDKIYEIINFDTPVEIKNKEWLKKHQRTYMFNYTIKKINESLESPKHKFKLVEVNSSSFILTDNPILYEKELIEFEDLDNTQYIFPISSTRGFIQFNKDNSKLNKPFHSKHIFWYNALAIEQSKRYSTASDIKNLQQSIKIYEHIKNNDLVGETKELLFNRISF